jgi:DNA-3-methyladenine glycosylase I
MNRCKWCTDDPLYTKYHDQQWGVPVHEDRLLFEFLVLEGAQAGLSWLTILRKREHYRKAFDSFDCKTVAGYSEQDVKRLLEDPGIVRNRRKIESAIKNARATLSIQEKYGSLDAFLWSYVGGRPIVNRWKAFSEVPTKSEISEKLSKDLQKEGFSFVGSTICYAFMQAVGMVNDHTTDCFRHAELARQE